jgi:hypothetical protein
MGFKVTVLSNFFFTMFVFVVQCRCKIIQIIYDESIITFFFKDFKQKLMELSTFILFNLTNEE